MNARGAQPSLLSHHERMLREESGLTAEVIAERGYRSATTKAEVQSLGFTTAQVRVPALLIPLHGVRGERVGYSLRPDEPRVGTDGKVRKYEQPAKSGAVLDIPLRCQPQLRDPATRLWITEGAKKADALAQLGACAINISGVWNWRGRNEFGGKTTLPEWDEIALEGRSVWIVFDSDVATKPAVASAMERLFAMLRRRKAIPMAVYLPITVAGGKQGIDDFLAAGGTLKDLDEYATGELVRRKPEDERPTIIVSGQFMPEISEAAWRVIDSLNKKQPMVFRRGQRLCRVERSGDIVSIVDLEAADIPFIVERHARCVAISASGDEIPTRLPQEVVTDIMAAWNKPVPELRGITGTPSFLSDGTLIEKKGYQAETGLFFDSAGMQLPAVPTTPSAEDLQRAIHLICTEWLGDFPFQDDASRAAAIAMPLTIMVRGLIDGHVPLFAVDAPAQATGKGLVTATGCLIATGRSPAMMSEVADDAELEKRITAILRAASPVAVIDNVKRRISSGALAAALTTDPWSGRLLGKSEQLTLPSRCEWIVTGNNLQFDTDIARRVVWCRIDTKRDRPEERTGFLHPLLEEWVRAHRAELVWAFLVLVRHWFASGRPSFSGKLMASFENWSRVVGGILECVGIHGLLANRDELYRHANAEAEEWREFVGAWWASHGNARVKAGDLSRLVKDEGHLPAILAAIRGEVTDQKVNVRLGKGLQERRDRRIGDLVIRFHGYDSHQKGSVYSLDVAEGDGDEAAPSADPPQPNALDPDSVAEGAESAEDESPSRARETAHTRGGRIYSERADGRDDSPHSPHSPHAGSKSPPQLAESGAEGRRQPPDSPRCRGCGMRMGVARVSEWCPTCPRDKAGQK